MNGFYARVRRVVAVLFVSFTASIICFGFDTSAARADDISGWLEASFSPPETATRSRRAGISRQGRSSLGRLAGEDRSARARRAKKGTRYAALGTPPSFTPPERSISGGVRWAASAGCLTSTLRSVVAALTSFGSVTVNSTCRSRRHNARVGGATRSYHLTGNAADFRVRGNVRAAHSYLRSNGSVGGLKHYGGGLFHIDTGPRRGW